MNFLFENIWQLAGWAVVFTSIVGLFFEKKRSNLTLSADLAFRLSGYWDKPLVRRQRKAAAEALLSEAPEEYAESIDPVLNHLELIGLLIRKGAIDNRTAYHLFSTPLQAYFESSEWRIEQLRAIHSSYWTELVYFHTAALKTAYKREHGFIGSLLGSKDLEGMKLTNDDRLRVLREEANISPI